MEKWIRVLQQSPTNAAQVMSSYHGRSAHFSVQLHSIGSALRVVFSNRGGMEDLVILQVSLKKGSTNYTLTHHGAQRLVVAPGVDLFCDPMRFKIRQGELLELTIVYGGTQKPTSGNFGLFTSGISTEKTKRFDPNMRYRQGLGLPGFLGIDVLNDHLDAIVAIGDSFTHAGSWPAMVEERFKTRLTLVNSGISGNQLIHDAPEGLAYYGPSLVSRFNADALEVPGVKVVFLEAGANDLLLNPKTSAQEMIPAYRSLINAAHDRGLRIILGTLTPIAGNDHYSTAVEPVRQAINDWIRFESDADAVLDSDRFLADPDQPDMLASVYDSGDHLHCNPAGYALIGEKLIEHILSVSD